ncbi:MAG TPA: hypothetical protein VGE38_16950 [Nocardioides sp.]|uniref:hypothetical protein n=1 Tax=Nocardioides sp. TaxID=35761 RepID=UPI002ED8AF09
MTTTGTLSQTAGVDSLCPAGAHAAPSSTATPAVPTPPTSAATIHKSPSASPATTANAVPSGGPAPLVAGTTAPSGSSHPAETSSGLGDFTYANLVTLAAALIAAAGVVVTLLVNAARSRRDNLATLYADALGAVAEYLEGPYRILRKDGDKSTRFAITSKLSDVKTSIDHNQALLRLHARPGVADAYDAFVVAAKKEAGKQMHEAWKVSPVTTDDGVNLHVALPRGDAEAARARLVEVMQADLHQRWWNRKSHGRYRDAVKAVADATQPMPAATPDEQGASE